MLDSTTSLYCRISALASCNRTELLQSCLRDAIHRGCDPGGLYEIFLQTYLFAGFPAALESLRMLFTEIKNSGIDWHPPALAGYDLATFRERGEALYKKIYSTNHQTLRDVVEKFSPDMFEYMIVEGYGKVLSRPGVTGAQRELATVTALTALGWERQVISHARGAINIGATAADVFEAITLAEECCDDQRVSKMMAAVAPHLKYEV